MENLRAIALMVLSMAGFAVEDMLIKYIALEMPTGQFLMLIGAGGALIFTLMAWKQGQAVLSADFLRPTIIIRNLGEVIGTLGFVTALVLTPLSSASAILQATPLAVTFGGSAVPKGSRGLATLERNINRLWWSRRRDPARP